MQKIKCTQKSGSNLLLPVIVVAASAYLFVNTITMLTQGESDDGDQHHLYFHVWGCFCERADPFVELFQ